MGAEYSIVLKFVDSVIRYVVISSVRVNTVTGRDRDICWLGQMARK